jgi:mannosyl transferase
MVQPVVKNTMHLFMLSSQVVYPPTDGGKQGIYYRMNALGTRTRVSVCMVNSANIAAADGGFDAVHHVRIIPQILKPSKECSHFELVCQTVHWLTSGLPRQALVTDSAEVRKQLMEYIRETRVTTILLESPFVAPLLDFPQLRKWNVKIVVVLHNIEHLYFQETTTWPAPLRSMEYERIKRYELQILRQADLGISISPWDAQYFKEQLGAPNVVYLPSVLPRKDTRWHSQNSNYILFTGGLSFPPNYEGIVWFLEEVFSRYRERFPKMELWITGKRSDAAERLARTYDHVHLTGFLTDPELRKVECGCRFIIVPILKGSGVKVKLLDAMAIGAPVVTTLHGRQGIFGDTQKAEAPFLCGEDADMFLQHMYDLTEDVDMATSLGERAQHFYDTTYASEENVDKWLRMFQ